MLFFCSMNFAATQTPNVINGSQVIHSQVCCGVFSILSIFPYLCIVFKLFFTLLHTFPQLPLLIYNLTIVTALMRSGRHSKSSTQALRAVTCLTFFASYPSFLFPFSLFYFLLLSSIFIMFLLPFDTSPSCFHFDTIYFYRPNVGAFHNFNRRIY